MRESCSAVKDSLSLQVNMGHGLTISAKFHVRIVKQLKKLKFLNARLQRIYVFRHLPHIIGETIMHATVLNKATCTREYFRKPFSQKTFTQSDASSRNATGISVTQGESVFKTDSPLGQSSPESNQCGPDLSGSSQVV